MPDTKDERQTKIYKVQKSRYTKQMIKSNDKGQLSQDNRQTTRYDLQAAKANM